MGWGGGGAVWRVQNHTTQNKELRTESQSSHLPFCSTSILSRGKTRKWKERQGREKIRPLPPKKSNNLYLHIQANTFTSKKRPSNGKMYTAHAEINCSGEKRFWCYTCVTENKV